MHQHQHQHQHQQSHWSELRLAHSHHCPKCRRHWGCVHTHAERGEALCLDCDPQVVRDGRNYVRLDLPRIERIRTVAPGYGLRVRFRNQTHEPIINGQEQVGRALRYVRSQMVEGCTHAVRLWGELFEGAKRS